MSLSIKKTLVSGAALTALLFVSGAALAQDDGGDDSVKAIVVTGTRVRSTFTTPTPVTVVSSQDLQLADPGNLVSAVVQLPEFYNSNTTSAPGNFFASPGTGNFNLRGLGTKRTLTLLNGRRVVESTRYGGTDINTFPKEMIKSVEAVTGGASAAYGTDAVSGVVNFILDTTFTGVRGHLQGGITERGDNENWEGSIAFGTPIGDKFHVLGSFEQYEQQPVYTYADRSWYQGWGLISNTSGSGAQFLVRPHVVSTQSSLDGIFTIGSTAASNLHMYEFLPDGSYRLFNPQPAAGQSTIGGANQAYVQPAGGSGTDNGADRPTLQPQTSRKNFFTYAEFDPTDNVKVFAQLIYGKNQTVSTNTGGQMNLFSPLTIYQDNAYLPTALNQELINDGQASFTLGRIGSAADLAANSFVITENAMTSATGGFEYDFLKEGLFGGNWFRNWRANGYYQWGENTFNAKQRGGFRVDRYALSADAVKDASGNIVCRVNLPQYAAVNGGRWSDCVPINLFGRGHASQAAIDWLTGYDPGQEIGPVVLEYTDSGTSLGITDHYISTAEKISSGQILQSVTEITLDGDLWEGWGAGAISGAIGYSYRAENMNQVVRIPVNPANSAAARPVPANDPATCIVGTSCLGVRGNPNGNINNSVAIQFSKVPNVRGSLYTGEEFGEILIPLVADLPFVKQLTVDGAARRALYSGSGGIWAWKYGFSWQVIGDVRLRGAQSRDVRAATLGERFDRTGGVAAVKDPCSTCTLLPGYGSYNAFLVSGGNPNVRPEKADTATLGVVFQPSAIKGLSMSVDWYDIRLKGSIDALGTQDIVDGCYQGATDLCARITRDAGSGLITFVNASYLNLNKARVRGVDTQIDYHRDIALFGGDESLSARVYVSYLDENSVTLKGKPKTEYAGGIQWIANAPTFANPRWKLTASATYANGPFSVYVQERYVDSVKLNAEWKAGNQVDNNTVDSVFYTDMTLSYKLNRMGGDWTMFLNVSNLLDQDPPVVANYSTFASLSTQALPIAYDLLGRRFVGGVRWSF